MEEDAAAEEDEEEEDVEEEEEEEQVRAEDAPIDSPLEQTTEDDYTPPHGPIAIVGKVFGFLLFWGGNGFLIFYLVPKIVMSLMGK